MKKRFVSTNMNNPSELEYYANRKECDFDEMLERRREGYVRHNYEFELARSNERMMERR